MLYEVITDFKVLLELLDRPFDDLAFGDLVHGLVLAAREAGKEQGEAAREVRQHPFLMLFALDGVGIEDGLGAEAADDLFGDLLAAQDGDFGLDFRLARRITSYNVCYTKLLRLQAACWMRNCYLEN